MHMDASSVSSSALLMVHYLTSFLGFHRLHGRSLNLRNVVLSVSQSVAYVQLMRAVVNYFNQPAMAKVMFMLGKSLTLVFLQVFFVLQSFTIVTILEFLER